MNRSADKTIGGLYLWSFCVPKEADKMLFRTIRKMTRNERGFTTLVAVTLIVSSLGGWKFGTLLAEGPTTEEETLKTAYAIEVYVKEEVEANKKDIDTTIEKAREIGKVHNLSVVYSYDSLGIYNIAIYQELADRTVGLYSFNVIVD